MVKMILAVMVTLMVGQFASAGCNPCVCGPGGGNPPDPACPDAGKWRRHSNVPPYGLETLHAVLSDTNVEGQLLRSGGLAEVKSSEANGAISFQFKAQNGAEFKTPNFAVPAQ